MCSFDRISYNLDMLFWCQSIRTRFIKWWFIYINT
jgi:hypothetical protein